MKLSELFYMVKSDRQVVLIALTVIVVALGVIWFGGSQGEGREADSLRLSGNNQLSGYPANHQKQGRYYATPMAKPERFVFDPNTADSTQLLRLGLQPWQVRNIYRYRQKGGVYRQKSDFARLYGLTVKEYRELEPYIQISRDYQPAATLYGNEQRQYSDVGRSNDRLAASERRDSVVRNYPYQPKIDEGERVILNTADTTRLKMVPGIGPYWARQIVRYGQRLGGYVSVDQLDEIDNFPRDTKRYFTIDEPSPQRLNVNQLSTDKLQRHPYLNYYQAKAIVDYRRLHGNIRSLQELRLSKDFPPEAIRRLEPYIEY